MTRKEMADMRDIARTLTPKEVASCTDRYLKKMKVLIDACYRKAQRAGKRRLAADFKHALDLFDAELGERS